MTCVECGAVVTDGARGWRAHRADLPAEAELEDPSTADVPPVVTFCPTCSEGEFGPGSDW
jgi:hypothetical protein